MGRWENGWFALMDAYRNDQISHQQFRTITDRHNNLPVNEATLQMLMSSTAAAREDYAKTKVVESGPGTEPATPGPAPDPAPLEQTS